MSYEYRVACLENLHPEITEMTLLKDLKKEFSLYEIAIMTRAAPARLLGQKDRGTLQAGARADIAIYREQENKSLMFRHAEKVFKNGELVLDDGRITQRTNGRTVTASVGFNQQIEQTVQDYFDRFYTMKLSHYGITDAFMEEQHRHYLATKVSGQYSA